MRKLFAEARVHPFQSGKIEPWLGLEAGVASIRDSVSWHGVPGRSLDAAVQYAPSVGLAFGADWYFIRNIGIGLEARATLFAFGRDPPDLTQPGDSATRYGTLVVAALAANLTWRM